MNTPVELSWEVSRSAIESPEAIHLMVMARIKAARDPACRRAPLNLSLVLDRSGSMAGQKLDQCKHAARFVVSHLTADDRFSVVTFDDEVDVVVPAGPVTSRDQVTGVLTGIRCGGCTNLSGGWLQGASLVEAARTDGQVNRVLLLTDGQANAGVVEPARLLGMAQDLNARKVQTTCIGFGEGFNEDLLKGLSDAGGGNFHFIDSPEEARSVFARELQELLQVAAQNVRLRVNPSRDVSFVEVLQDYPMHTVEGGFEIDLGDLMAGEDKPIVLHFSVPRALAGRRGVTTLSLSFHQVLGEVALRELSAFIETPERGAEAMAVNPVVWREVLLGMSAREMKEAIGQADRGEIDGARKRLLDARQRLAESAHHDEPEYQERQAELARLADMLDSEASYRVRGRKSLRESSWAHGRTKMHTRGGTMHTMLRKRLSSARSLVFLTGPGLSPATPVPSGTEATGIAAADEAGLERQWRWIRERAALIAECLRTDPSRLAAHEALAQAAASGRWDEVTIVTSANDGLHAAVTRGPVLELYGSARRGRCPADGRVVAVDRAKDGVPRCPCGATLRPDVAWRDEDVDPTVMERARRAVASADGVIVAGTYARKRPMASLVAATRAPVVGVGPMPPQELEWAALWLDAEPTEGLLTLLEEITWH